MKLEFEGVNVPDELRAVVLMYSLPESWQAVRLWMTLDTVEKEVRRMELGRMILWYAPKMRTSDQCLVLVRGSKFRGEVVLLWGNWPSPS